VLIETHLEAAEGRQLASIPAAFDRVIKDASNNGYDHDAALGSQLAAEYCMSVMQRIDRVSEQYTAMDTLHCRYLQRAIDLYQSWGALALMDHLESKKHRSS